MKCLVPFLAAVDIGEYIQQQAAKTRWARSTHETVLLFGVLLAITLGLFLCVYVLYRNRRRGLARSPYPPSQSQGVSGKKAGSTPRGRRRRRWHRRRREHRPRNPTLEETGGLPPIRSGDQPPRPPP